MHVPRLLMLMGMWLMWLLTGCVRERNAVSSFHQTSDTATEERRPKYLVRDLVVWSLSHTHDRFPSWSSCTICRSTLRQSRPNKSGLKCPSVNPSVHRQSFFDFSEVWHVGRGRWVRHDGMQYSELEIRPFSEAISSAIYNVSLQLTTDS